ncbi:hypothetical protein CEXT_466781 [Caerostris extrusa]|uniref:Secreted protein n=1 Tax=Caerostris extrusa TaxID=172846 RepID=A0AAV4TQK9_CAEEX|nr:hypothetical protein CEXT_466781 [Caerostris extrusa]
MVKLHCKSLLDFPLFIACVINATFAEIKNSNQSMKTKHRNGVCVLEKQQENLIPTPENEYLLSRNKVHLETLAKYRPPQEPYIQQANE